MLITIAGLLLLIEIADNINFTGGHNSINNNFVSEPSSTSLYISDVTIGTEGITFSGLSFGDDEQSIKYEKQQTQDQLVAIEPTGQINGYNYVDLGLSVYWALENVGASSYYDDGDYYAWGEIKSKDIYTVDNYFDSKNSTMEYSKYNEYTNILELEDDVAHVIMGDPWRMPTSNEMDELVENCDWSIVETKNGLGMMGTSKINGKNIFLPATGYKSGEKGTSFHRDEAYYRSSMISHNPSLAFCIRIIISRNIIERYNASRESGFTIRAVSSKNII